MSSVRVVVGVVRPERHRARKRTPLLFFSFFSSSRSPRATYSLHARHDAAETHSVPEIGGLSGDSQGVIPVHDQSVRVGNQSRFRFRCFASSRFFLGKTSLPFFSFFLGSPFAASGLLRLGLGIRTCASSREASAAAFAAAHASSASISAWCSCMSRCSRSAFVESWAICVEAPHHLRGLAEHRRLAAAAQPRDFLPLLAPRPQTREPAANARHRRPRARASPAVSRARRESRSRSTSASPLAIFFVRGTIFSAESVPKTSSSSAASFFSSDASAPTVCATSMAFVTCFAGTAPGARVSYHVACFSHPTLYPPSALSRRAPTRAPSGTGGCTRGTRARTTRRGRSSSRARRIVDRRPYRPCLFLRDDAFPSPRSRRARGASPCARARRRSRASSTVTSTPAFLSTRAALRPAGPAPTTTTRGARPVIHAGRGRSRASVEIEREPRARPAAAPFTFRFLTSFSRRSSSSSRSSPFAKGSPSSSRRRARSLVARRRSRLARLDQNPRRLRLGFSAVRLFLGPTRRALGAFLRRRTFLGLRPRQRALRLGQHRVRRAVTSQVQAHRALREKVGVRSPLSSSPVLRVLEREPRAGDVVEPAETKVGDSLVAARHRADPHVAVVTHERGFERGVGLPGITTGGRRLTPTARRECGETGRRAKYRTRQASSKVASTRRCPRSKGILGDA